VATRERLVCLAWVAMLIACGGANADDLREVVRSPYGIQRYVQTHEALTAGDLWKALGIPELLSDPQWPNLARGFDCRSDLRCEAWIEPMQLSWERTRFVALRFAQEDRQLNRYLVFEQEGTVWKLAGHIDSVFAKYFDPILYPKELGGKWWLVLREQSGSGTGYHESIQRWFEMKGEHLREVLSILDQAYILGYPGHYISRPAAIATDFQRTERGDLVRVLYRLAFTLVDDDGVDRGFLGSIEKTAVYRRRANETTFHLDATKGASENDIETIFWPSFRPNLATDFLRNDLQGLLRIARGPKSAERRWLAETLKEFPPGVERRELMRALAAGAAH
jgi:hypothetical protein